MSTDHGFVTPDARRDANRLLEMLQRERIAAAIDPAGPGPSEFHAKLALIERAKGALMLHYGVDSHRAFAVLVGWARISHTPLPTIAHTLLRGICEGNPQTEIRERALMRWLEAQLREAEPGYAQLRPAPAPRGPAHETPRSAGVRNGGVQGRASHADMRPCITRPRRGAQPPCACGLSG